MEDTLRYFFSAVFQGFAALVTLGAMFYLYYRQNISEKRKSIEQEMYLLFPASGQRDILSSEGTIPYIQTFLKKNRETRPIPYKPLESLMISYNSLTNEFEKVKKEVPKVIIFTFFILVISMVSLFLVGLCSKVNNILEYIGIFLIGISSCYFLYVGKIIMTTLKD